MSDDTLFEGQYDMQWSLEHLAIAVLEAAGIDVEPRAYLVGITDDGAVTIEPERGSFDTVVLTGVLGRAERRTISDDDMAGAPTDSAAHAAFVERLTEQHRRVGLAEALTASARAADRIVYVGRSEMVDDARVFPVITVWKDEWALNPKLQPTDAVQHTLSYPEALVLEVLDRASDELGRRVPRPLHLVEVGDVLASAADALMAAVLRLTGQELGHGARRALDAVSTQLYEGREGTGTVVFARRGHPSVAVDLELEAPVSILATRSFRKVLEMASHGLSLLSDGREVFGLGRLEPAYEPNRQDCFTVGVSASGLWELWHAGTAMLRVDNGAPAMPRELLDGDEFGDVIDRVFGQVSARNAQTLWDIADACSTQAHGTMLVVHPDAAAERERLMPQAYAIRPTRLAGLTLRAATAIDGAVLVAPDGQCHAVGVILDGEATGTGDSSRGARYNSAIRYLAGAGRGAMVIIVSEDGKIDLLPRQMRRVRRSHVQRLVDRLVAASAEDVAYETFARLDRYVTSLEFYFDEAQCEAVNTARQNVEQRRWSEDGMAVATVPIAPDPALDDSYFLPE